MEYKNPFEADAEEQLNKSLNEAVTTAKLDEEQLLITREIRLGRALDYQSDALRKDDPLEACIGGLNAGLIRVACYLEDAVEQSLAKEPATIEKIRQLGPALDAYMRLTRQVERFAQVEARLAEGRKEAENVKSKLQMLALQGHAPRGKAK